MKKTLFIALVFLTLSLTACGATSAPAPNAQDVARKNAEKNKKETFNQKNRIDFRNFNARQKITDDPSTIFWCTLYPPTQGQEPTTFAFAGKITSSTKSPFAPYWYADRGSYTFTQQPQPTPDGMFGTSDPYVYGLDPSGQILDQTNLGYNCSNAPTTYQANQTKIVSGFDPKLMALSQEASALIKEANTQKGAAKRATLAKADRLLRSASTVAGQPR